MPCRTCTDQDAISGDSKAAAYGINNPCRLLGIVHATLVCPDLEELARVADAVRDDERVRVLREKNKFADKANVHLLFNMAPS